jgi:hypothetical protein
MRRLNVPTWHTHGGYLYYLPHAPHEFHALAKRGRPPGYGGRCGPFPFGPNVHDLPADQARAREFDCILFQEDHHWERDQYELLTPVRRTLPRNYLEHDPPALPAGGDAPDDGRAPPGTRRPLWPTDMRHPVDDPAVLLVHVTPYNDLMWDSGRRMGADRYGRLRTALPLDLVGMGATELGGLGEIAELTVLPVRETSWP